jgi:DNA polymerase IV
VTVCGVQFPNVSIRALFIDFNSYFASAEQHLRPELRGKPVAVAPVTSDGGCCIAASYEAKAFGVKTGTRVGEAKRMCPKLIIVDARPSEYIKLHHRLLEAIERHLPVQGVHSIDEVSCILDIRDRTVERATELAGRIKAGIARDVGETMRCSIGVAPNRMLAKLATDMQKPNGLVIIRKEELPGRLYHLALEDFPGIGPRMGKRLREKGVMSVEQLCASSRKEMETLWESVLGWKWYLWLRGEDVHEPATTRRSIGHQHVLAPELRTPEAALAVAQRLVSKAASRMRMMGYEARTLALAVTLDARGDEALDAARRASHQSGHTPLAGGTGTPRYVGRDTSEGDIGPDGRRRARGESMAGWRDGERGSGWETAWGTGNVGRHWHATISLGHGSQDTLRLIREVNELWRRVPRGAVKLVSTTLCDLIAVRESTMPLFESERRDAALSKAMDEINQRYGRNAIHTGAVHDVKDTARGGIAFHVVPDLEVADGVE